MLKNFFNPRKAERHPFEIFVLGLIYSSVSIVFSLWVFPEYASIAMIFLTVFSCLYLIQSAIKIEEEKETRSKKESSLLKEHSKLINLLLFLFLGFTISFTIWSLVLSSEKVSSLFAFQESAVAGIRAGIGTGSFANFQTFFAILTNNIKVLIISLIFAFFYGAGAIYILVWNASVMGLVIGSLARNTLGIISLPIAFTKYFLHGIPEMIAYFTTALAGGIVYTALWKEDLKDSKKRKKIIKDVIILIGISLGLLIIAGLIEIYISPYI
jgi:uncharacterized membrane protein SpoIIM required for sporulation